MAPDRAKNGNQNHERRLTPRGGSKDGSQDGERQPLLDGQRNGVEDGVDELVIDFEEDDEEDPRHWTKRRKYVNVAVIALMASE